MHFAAISTIAIALVALLVSPSSAGEAKSAPAASFKPFPIDITKPVTESESVYAELSALDEFLQHASHRPKFVYLPIRVTFHRSEDVLRVVRFDCGTEVPDYECAPDFFSPDVLSSVYTAHWLDSDQDRAVTNFVRHLLDPSPGRRSATMFAQLPVFRPGVAKYRNPNYPQFGVIPASGDRAEAWFANPCNFVSESGRDDGWLVKPGVPNSNPTLRVDSECSVSETGSGLTRLSPAELRAFQAWGVDDRYVFKNQPTREMQGEDPDRYFGFLAIRPTATMKPIPSFFAGNGKSADQLSNFEKQVLGRLLVEARAAIASFDHKNSILIPRKVSFRFGEGSFADINVHRQKSDELNFPASALRASFLQCSEPIDNLLRFVRSEAECKRLGGQVRDKYYAWGYARQRVLSGRETPSAVARAEETSRQFYCQRGNGIDRQRKLIDKFNACVVDKVWFLLHHELAHLYLRRGAAPTEIREDRADCYGLRAALTSRPEASLGIFESGVIRELENPTADSARLLPEQVLLVRQRYDSLKRIMPLVASNSLTNAFCDSYSSRGN